MLKLASFSFATAAVGALALAGAANAASWKFKVYNKSNTAAIEFRTQEDGEWSSNWITERIEPGDYFDMDFGTDKGDCTVRTQIRFTDGSYFDTNVDYCKISNLYIYENRCAAIEESAPFERAAVIAGFGLAIRHSEKIGSPWHAPLTRPSYKPEEESGFALARMTQRPT